MDDLKNKYAVEYTVLKQKQSLGSIAEHEAFIMRFAFMAGFDKAKQHLIDTGEMATADQWFSVKDRLPEIGQYVQACIPGGVLLYSCVLEKNNEWYGYGYSQPETRITHWMPLSTAPKNPNNKS